MDYFDDDDRLDVYVANDLTENFLFLNRTGETGHESEGIRLEESSALSGAGYVEGGREQAGMGVGSGDTDGDGRPDLYVTNFSDDYNTLYHNEGGGLFTDRSFEARLGDVTFKNLAWATGLVDVDNDGDLDLFVVNGHIYPEADRFESGTSYAQANQLFENLGDGTFRDISAAAGLHDKRLGRGAAFGDIDDDGDLDVVVANMQAKPSLLENEGGNKGNWVAILLVGDRSNRDGVGARVELRVGGRLQYATAKAGEGYLSSHDRRIHFGLGKVESAADVRVRWPSGTVTSLGALSAGRVYVVKEGRGVVSEAP
jgi:enediyne biosynthesis protein E4